MMTMKIQELGNYLLSGTDASELTGNLLPVAEKANFGEPTLQGAVSLLREKKRVLDLALRRSRSSEYTTQLAARDVERDDCFESFRDGVKSKLKKRDPAVREAAGKIFEVIRKYGTTLQNDGYKEQSMKLDLLFQDLAGGGYPACLATVKLEADLEELKQSQINFDQVYNEKLEAEAEQDLPGVMEAKKDLVRALNFFITLLNMQDYVHPGHRYGEVVGQTAEAVSHTLTIARARKSRGEATEEGNSPD